jgi:tartrate dehydratase alpha subunit/fumarate hydratase class I-like protein
MTVIREADVIASVADALQYISYYHTPDFIRAMGRAYDMDEEPIRPRCHSADTDQFSHVRRRASAHMS